MPNKPFFKKKLRFCLHQQIENFQLILVISLKAKIGKKNNLGFGNNYFMKPVMHRRKKNLLQK